MTTGDRSYFDYREIFFVSEMSWDADELSIHFWILTAFLFISFYCYYLFYYKRRIFHEERRKQPSYENWKFQHKVRAFGLQKALDDCFELDKLVFALRFEIALQNYIDIVMEDLENELLLVAKSKKRIEIKTVSGVKKVLVNKYPWSENIKNYDIEEEPLLKYFVEYNLNREKFDKIMKNKDYFSAEEEHFKLHGKFSEEFENILMILDWFERDINVLKVYFSHFHHFCQLVDYLNNGILEKIFIVKQMYEEAYYLNNLDLDSLRKKYNLKYFYEQEIIYFHEYKQYRDQLEAMERRIKEEEEAKEF